MSQKDIVVDRLCKVYGQRKVVDELSFQIPNGTIHGILGPNGAGKTTTIKMLAGLLQPTSGNISILGHNPSENSLHFKNLLGLLPEEPPLYLDMTVHSFLLWVAKIHQIQKEEALLRLKKMMTELDLLGVEHRLIGNLSKGFKQRVALCSALIFDPPVIILDEPSSGLDPNLVIDIRSYIKGLKKHKTILFSSHILSEVEALCDGVTIIHHGKMKAHGTLAEVKSKLSGIKTFMIEFQKEDKKKLSIWKSNLGLEKVEVIEERELIKAKFIIKSELDLRAQFLKELITAGFSVTKYDQDEPVLEEVFHELTKGNL